MSPIRTLVALAVVLGSLGACGDDDDRGDAVPNSPSTSGTTEAPATTGASATAPTDPPPTTEDVSTATDPPVTTVAVDPLAAEIQGILDAALVSEAIAWNPEGVDVSPTGAVAAVRTPGREDIVVASGESVDGDRFDAEASFNVGPLTESLVQTIAYQLVDEGLLDPTATVDRWLPAQPNADRITIQMLLDHTHGWAPFGDVGFAAVVADLTRVWTLPEVLATVEATPPFAEPGTFTNEGFDVAATAIAHIAEQLTGSTLAELVDERIAQPVGLTDTAISAGDEPADFEDAVFQFDGVRTYTSTSPHTAYNTYFAAEASVNSTARDLLDLLDAWQRGDLFSTSRVPGPDRLLADRTLEVDLATTGVSFGLGIPFNGFCPCQPDGAGLSVTAIGRAPSSLGTDNHIFHYPADGVSVVLHFNSADVVDRTSIRATVDAIHEAAIS